MATDMRENLTDKLDKSTIMGILMLKKDIDRVSKIKILLDSIKYEPAGDKMVRLSRERMKINEGLPMKIYMLRQVLEGEGVNGLLRTGGGEYIDIMEYLGRLEKAYPIKSEPMEKTN